MKRLLDWLRGPARPKMTPEEKAQLALNAFPKCC